ncbi:MAG TPA: VOC family protein [Xanthobacteraceae bacterium]|nr:VOC family protein [Xanthobacteraceae bacterium]
MSQTAVQAGAYLHHLQLQSSDPAKLADFYARALDMRSEKMADGRWLCRGPSRRVLFAEGAPKTLGFAAFACRDRDALDALRKHVSARAVTIETAPTPLFREGAFAVRDPDGNMMVFGLALEGADRSTGLKAPLQHVTIASEDVPAIEAFYVDVLGFAVSDRVRNTQGDLTTSFLRSNHEHHTLACFRRAEKGLDHHSYEAGEWILIRDWSDRFGSLKIPLMWGPGRHGPGNNLFVFIADPEGNWIEVSAELEVIHDRPVQEWPHEPRTLNLWGQAIMRS